MRFIHWKNFATLEWRERLHFCAHVILNLYDSLQGSQICLDKKECVTAFNHISGHIEASSHW